jgi:hypothetical protein
MRNSYYNYAYELQKININQNIKTFTDAIEHFTEDNSEIWHYQKYYDNYAMRFLLQYPNLLCHCDIDINKELGLLFASTSLCNLKVCEIPHLLDYKISNYNNIERIKIL